MHDDQYDEAGDGPDLPEHLAGMRRPPARYGWVPDLPDHRDHLFAAPAEVMAALPASVDLRDDCPAAIYDQGQLGSCTANAIGAAIEYARIKAGHPSAVPSRLFIYYNERVIEGTVRSDAGAMIRDGIKTCAKQGVCPETDWPYIIGKFAKRPPASCYTQARGDTVTAYQRVTQSLPAMKGALAAGWPFVVGFTVFESFESAQVARTGVVAMPTGREQALGGHAVLVVGYDDVTGRWLLRNSWGKTWGQAGYFTMPYAYLLDGSLASDFWAITAIN